MMCLFSTLKSFEKIAKHLEPTAESQTLLLPQSAAFPSPARSSPPRTLLERDQIDWVEFHLSTSLSVRSVTVPLFQPDFHIFLLSPAILYAFACQSYFYMTRKEWAKLCFHSTHRIMQILPKHQSKFVSSRHQATVMKSCVCLEGNFCEFLTIRSLAQESGHKMLSNIRRHMRIENK